MSGVATRLAVGDVRERGGEQAVAALLAHAGERRTVAQLEDERGWSGYAQCPAAPWRTRTRWRPSPACWRPPGPRRGRSRSS